MSYNDTSKVGVLLSAPARQDDLMNKIDNWKSNEKTACAWPGILKSEIVSGLNKIVEFYFSTNRYVDHQHLETSLIYFIQVFAKVMRRYVALLLQCFAWQN